MRCVNSNPATGDLAAFRKCSFCNFDFDSCNNDLHMIRG